MLPQYHHRHRGHRRHNHQQPPQDNQVVSSQFSTSSSSTRPSTMSTGQEYVNKETESTVTLSDRRQGPSSNLGTNVLSDKRHREPWYGNIHLGMPAPSHIQPFEQREPTDAEVQSAQFSSQSLQDNGSERPSKRRRGGQHASLPPLSSSSRTSSTSRLALPASSTSTAPVPLNGSGIHHDGPQPEVVLLDSNLWAKFNEHQNEMIITTSGRCLFPCLRFKAVNLNPDAYYSFRLEFEMIAPNRFRFSNGAWKAVGFLQNIDNFSAGVDTVASDHKSETYTHPDRLKLGSHWMANPISFAKAKLANKAKSQSTVAKKFLKPKVNSTSSSKRKADSTSATDSNDGPGGPHPQPLGDNHNDTNVFHMESFHKYRPRVVLTELAKDSNEILSTTVYTFDLATFMAVTRYENENVNDLKKSFNPHARAFRGTVSKIPTGERPRHQEMEKRSSLVNPTSRVSKRTRSTSRLEETGSDSEDGMNIDYDPHEAEVDMDADVSDLEAVGSVDVSMTGVPKNNSRPTCRLEKDNSALVTISLGKDAKQIAKVSEQTTQHHFAQHHHVPQHGGMVDILRLHSHFTTKGVFSMGQQFFSAEEVTAARALMNISASSNLVFPKDYKGAKLLLTFQHFAAVRSAAATAYSPATIDPAPSHTFDPQAAL